MRTILIILLAIIVIGCAGNKHTDVKVKALHTWEKGRAKNCMLLTGRSVVEGGKAGPDPKEMWCTDQRKADPNDMSWEYVHISNVVLDQAGQQSFHNSQNWGVPLVCEEVSLSELKCLFDGSSSQ